MIKKLVVILEFFPFIVYQINEAIRNDISYAVENSVTPAITSKSNEIENFAYKITNGVLQMSPAGPIFCFEGCDQRFTKTR